MGRFEHWYDYLNPFNYFGTMSDNLSDGYQLGDLSKGLLGINTQSAKAVSDSVTDSINDHGLNEDGEIEVNPADPTSSATNVINYDPNKSALDNMLGYAQDNNSASAYSAYLENKHATEMANSSLARSIADAEANGISKYQLFQSGNAGAASPSSAGSLYSSYENAMNRREGWNEKELAAIVAIVQTAMNSAGKLLKAK